MKLLWPSFLGIAASAWVLAAFGAIAAEDADLSPAIIERCKAATVLVDLGREGSGSGFFVHSCGLFVTNRHVAEAVPPGAPIKLVLNSGQPNQKILPARVVMISQDEDLALLKTDEPVPAQPLPLSDDAGLVELAKAVVFGYPFGKMLAEGSERNPAISVNAGHVSALRREAGQLERIQLDAATNPGNSGGPVVGKDGVVMGIIVSGIPGAGVNFAIPAAKVIAMIKQPVLSLRAPNLTYAQRGEARDFEVEVFPTAPIPSDGEINLLFGDPDAPRRSFPVVRKDGKYLVNAAPSDTVSVPGQPRLRLEATFGGVITMTANVDDCALQAGAEKRPLRLSELREIDHKKNTWKTTLVHFDKERKAYETVEGKLTGLPLLHSQVNELTLDLNEAEYIKIGAYDPGLIKMPYELAMSSKGKPVAACRGVLVFADPPCGLESEAEPGSFAHNRRRGPMIFLMPGSDAGFEMGRLIDPAKDARQGTWERQGAVLETSANPVAWCDIPAIPEGDYHISVRFTPRQKETGELLLPLPLGKARALLRMDGKKGILKLDADGSDGADDEGSVRIPPFQKDKERSITVEVAVSGDEAQVMAIADAARPLMWDGKIKRLSAPKDVPTPTDHLAIGHRGLQMTVESISIGAGEDSMRILREAPEIVRRIGNTLLGRWSLDNAPKQKRLPNNGGSVGATLIGSPQIGVPPAIGGTGAMKLGDGPSGFQLDETDATTRAWHAARTDTLWFMADAPDAKDQRQYLLDDGGGFRGYAIYLENGTLFAGGWDDPAKWKGTWLKAPGIVAGKWYHVTLVLDADGKDKRKALGLYLNGREVARGWGNGVGTHEAMAIGTVLKSTRACPDEPVNPAAANHQFAGMIDEVEIYNAALGPNAIKILAGRKFQTTAPAQGDEPTHDLPPTP